MVSALLGPQSLKTRIVLAMLAVCAIGIWTLAFYVSRMLQEELQALLSDQEFSTVSYIAADINTELTDRLGALESFAGSVNPAIVRNATSLQALLEQRPILQNLFNGGVIAYGFDGRRLAQVPPSAEPTSLDFTNRDYLLRMLKEGKSAISDPFLSQGMKVPQFFMAVPIRDPRGKALGALAGVVNLGKANFLDDIAGSRYGKTGGYLLVAPRHQLVVVASDKTRIMERLPDPGINPVIDRFRQGYEGSAILVNPAGVEVLVSSKGIPVPGWKIVAMLPTAEAFAPIRSMQWRILLVTIFLALPVGALTWWILRRQLAPMLATSKMLGAMSDRSQPLHALPITRQDELGQLIGGFNRLLETLGRREKALEESEAVLRESQRNAGLGSYALDVATGSWKSSAMLDSLFGIDEKYEHTVEGWKALIHPDDRAMMVDYFQNEVLGQGRAFDKVYRIIRHDDRIERWVHGLGKPESDAEGRPLKMHGTIQDITERKQAEDALRESHRQLRDLAASLQAVREEERTALARELHDELGQHLLRLRMDLSWLEGRIKIQAPALHEKVEGMKHFISGTVDSLRHLTTELRLPLLDDLGLADAALWVLNDFAERTGIEVISTVAMNGTLLEERVTINVFRILQESLTNIVRHAGAKQVIVSLTTTDEGLVLDVRDNGCGTDLPGEAKLGHGLIGIRERSLLLGGSMELASARGQGFAIRVRVPLAASSSLGEQT